jgi:hypothetical protein
MEAGLQACRVSLRRLPESEPFRAKRADKRRRQPEHADKPALAGVLTSGGPQGRSVLDVEFVVVLVAVGVEVCFY